MHLQGEQGLSRSPSAAAHLFPPPPLRNINTAHTPAAALKQTLTHPVL